MELLMSQEPSMIEDNNELNMAFEQSMQDHYLNTDSGKQTPNQRQATGVTHILSQLRQDKPTPVRERLTLLPTQETQKEASLK